MRRRLVTLCLSLAAVMSAAGCELGRRCEVVPTQVSTFCVPGGGAAPNVTLRAQESCGGCNEEAPACSATVDGNTITLSLAVTRCEAFPGQACPAVCRMAIADCKLGPLPEGVYTVKAGDAQQTMTVTTGGDSGCEIASP